MISVSSISRWAGPIIDVLLDYVGHVTLCSRLMEHLDSYSEWSTIKEKAGESLTDKCYRFVLSAQFSSMHKLSLHNGQINN